MNLYGYTANDPVNNTDPMGLECVEISTGDEDTFALKCTVDASQDDALGALVSDVVNAMAEGQDLNSDQMDALTASVRSAFHRSSSLQSAKAGLGRIDSRASNGSQFKSRGSLIENGSMDLVDEKANNTLALDGLKTAGMFIPGAKDVSGGEFFGAVGSFSHALPNGDLENSLRGIRSNNSHRSLRRAAEIIGGPIAIRARQQNLAYVISPRR